MSSPSHNEYCEEDNVTMGKPTVKEMQEYWTNPGRWNNQSDTESSEEEEDLSSSFQVFLEKRLNDLRKHKMNNSDISDRDMTTSAFDNTNHNDVHNKSLGGDDTFSKFEKLCEELNPLENLKDDINLTQLTDMEEPSHFWENTINNMSKLLSPVKMCGMLRPSTIIEEDSQMNSTASNSALSSMSTNELVRMIDNIVDDNKCESESDNASLTSSTTTNFVSMHNTEVSLVTKAQAKMYEITSSADDSYATAGSSTSTISNTTSKSASTLHDSMDSLTVDTIDPLNFKTPTSSKHDLIKFTPFEKSEISKYFTAESRSNYENTGKNEVIDISSSNESEDTDDDDEAERPINNTLEDVSSLKSDSILSRDSLISENNPDENLNSSHEFNDTLEEVDYIMRKGLQYMDKNSELAMNITKSIPQLSRVMTPKTPDTVIKRKPIIKYGSKADDDFKVPSYPKLQSFRVMSQKKNKYDHIVSPLHLYINNTPIAPFTTGERTSRRDIFESKLSMRDSRFFPNQKSTKENLDVPTSKSSYNFPRKAYISSETQHVVDERVQPRIYGGEKVNRLFGGHNSPTIIRHDGHIKTKTAYERPITDSSMNDLSLDVGDISFQVLKTGEKF